MSKKNKKAQELVSPPGPLTIRSGDQVVTFLVSPPTLADQMTMRRWIRQRPREADKSRGFNADELSGLPPEDRRVLLESYAKAKATPKELDPEDMMDALQTPEGCAYMVWLSARRNEPGLQLERLRAIITPENVDQVLADFDTAIEIRDEDADPKAQPGAGSG